MHLHNIIYALITSGVGELFFPLATGNILQSLLGHIHSSLTEN